MVLRAGHGIALLTLALLVLGVVMVNSAGLLVGSSAQKITHQLVFLGPPMQHALLATCALCLGAMLPVRRIAGLKGGLNPAPWMLLGSILLLVLVWAPMGITMNSSSRWLDIGGVRFQASEFAKWSLPVFLGWFLTRDGIEIHRFLRGLLPTFLVIGLVTGLIAIEDLGTAFLLGAVAVVMLLAAGARFWHMLCLAPLAIGGLVFGIIAQPYRMARLAIFRDPWVDPEGAGWHIIQSLRAISGGGFLGRGLGAGEQKFDLAEDTTDFIFSIICEELGLLGATLVIAAFVGLLVCGLSIICRRNGDGERMPVIRSEAMVRLIGLGIILTVGMQALFNILVTTSLVPTKGIALPLVSRGGTGWILTAFCLGLLIAIERTGSLRGTDPPESGGPGEEAGAQDPSSAPEVDAGPA